MSETTRQVPAEFKAIASICTATEIAIGAKTVLGIADARKLHAGLRVGRDYSTWVKSRISALGLVEGIDFGIFPGSGENKSVGRPTKEYSLTLDAAKHIAMVEKNEIGMLVRRYFIWCEERAQTNDLAAIPDNESMSLKIVTEGRQTFGTKAAQQLWFLRGLPVVPAMRQSVATESDIFGSDQYELLDAATH